jgi:hypothetical protein
VPTALMLAELTGGFDQMTHSHAIELTDRILYFFDLSDLVVTGEGFLMLQIENVDGALYSEMVDFVAVSALQDRNIVTVLAYNDDFRFGYLNTTYPSAGFFEFKDLTPKGLATNKVEYNYSFGRKKILRAENYLRKRLSFINLSMYQQNLLKFLCNTQNLYIDGVQYQLISDFTEVKKDEDNEICDLQAEFVSVAQKYTVQGATEIVTNYKPDNLFM